MGHWALGMGHGEMGRWGDGEMGRWGDGEMERWRDGEVREKNCYLVPLVPLVLFSSPMPHTQSKI